MDSQDSTSRNYGSYNTTADSQLSPDINLFRSTNNEGRQAILWISPKKDSTSAPFLLESNFIETLKALPEHLSCPIIDRDPSQPPMWVAHQAPDGQSINDFINAVEQLDIPTAQSLFIKLIDLVQDLHQADFCHGNLRPETIFIGEGGIEIAPSYEFVERNLASNLAIDPQKWISAEQLQHKLPTAEEDVQAIALLFVFVLGGIRNPNVVNRADLLNQASKYLSALPISAPCSKILLGSLTESDAAKPSISEVMWAIENLTNFFIEKTPLVMQSSENLEVNQGVPLNPFQLTVQGSQGNKRPTKKNLIYSAVAIIYLVTVILLIVAKSNNSALNSEVKELNGQIDSLLNDIDDKDNTISSLEEDLSSVQNELATTNNTVDVLQQPQSTYFDYDGSWSLSLNGDESCTGWTSNNVVCARIPNNLTISSGSIFFDGDLISTITDGYSTLGGYFGSSTDYSYSTCGGYDLYADITINMTATEISPSPTGIIATVAYGDVLIKTPSQHGCNAASISFSFTATR